MLPSLKSLDALRLACEGAYGAHRSLEIEDQQRDVYGRSVVLTLPVKGTGTGAPSFEAIGVTHVAVQHNAGAAAYMYHVVRWIQLPYTQSEMPYQRMECELCGVFTAMLADPDFSLQQWEFDRYLPENSYYNRTTEPIDNSTTKQWTVSATFNYSFPAAYCVVVTLKSEPSSGVVAAESASAFVKPRCHVLITTSATIPTTLPGISAAQTGSFAIVELENAITMLGTDFTDRIYRVQLVPRAYLTATAESAASRRWYMSSPGSTTHAFFEALPPTLWYPNVIVNQPAAFSQDYKKVYGEPIYALRVRGVKQMEFPAIPDDADNDGIDVAGCKVSIGAVQSSGLNMYAEVRWSNRDLVIDKIPIPLPECTTIGDKLSDWWEGAKTNVLSTAALGLTAIGTTIATGGAAAPAVIAGGISAASTGAATLHSVQQASRQVKTTGSGAADLYATTSKPVLELMLCQYHSEDLETRRRFFALNGYSGSWIFDSLPAEDEQRAAFWYARGSGSCLMLYEQNTPVTQTELDAAIAEEIGAGVYFWYTNIGSPVSTANPTPTP